MQQARDSQAEKADEVVRNHEVGTGLLAWYARGRRRGGDIGPGVDAREHVDEGAMRSVDKRTGSDARAWVRPDESQERRSDYTDRGESAKL